MSQENITYLVDIPSSDGGSDTYQVVAAKAAYDERYYPAFIQLRDAAGEIAALVPIGAHPLIRRKDSDPTMRTAVPRPPAVPGSITAAKAPKQAPASPADVARLATVGSKPGAV